MYKMSIAGKIIIPLVFLLFVSCTTNPDTTKAVVVYKLNDRDYIFCVNDSYYLPINVEGTNWSEESIKLLFPDVTTDTLFSYNEKVCVQPKGESIFFANNILCITKSIICDACINELLMYVNVYDKDGTNHCIKCSLQPEELLIIDFLRDKLQRERQFVYIDPMDINESSCNYDYMIIIDSIKGGKKFFVSGGNPNEPTSCAMLSEFIESLVLKHLSNDHQNDDVNQYYSDNLRKIRIMLEQLEKDYLIVPEIPVWKDL